LFFVRVNQVLVRLWARAMEAEVIRVRPAVRLMSDRESCLRVSKHGDGAPKSGSEGSEACCVN